MIAMFTKNCIQDIKRFRRQFAVFSRDMEKMRKDVSYIRERINEQSLLFDIRGKMLNKISRILVR